MHSPMGVVFAWGRHPTPSPAGSQGATPWLPSDFFFFVFNKNPVAVEGPGTVGKIQWVGLDQGFGPGFSPNDAWSGAGDALTMFRGEVPTLPRPALSAPLTPGFVSGCARGCPGTCPRDFSPGCTVSGPSCPLRTGPQTGWWTRLTTNGPDQVQAIRRAARCKRLQRASHGDPFGDQRALRRRSINSSCSRWTSRSDSTIRPIFCQP